MSTLTKTWRLLSRSLAVLMLVGAFAPGGVMAAAPPAANNFTDAGTSVSNTAQVNYEVGGIAQTQIDSNTDSFLVDRRVNVFVTEVSGASASVTPDQSNFDGSGVMSFHVTNTGNYTQDILLVASNLADATADPHGGNVDSWDTQGAFALYVDVNANGDYDSGTDTAVDLDGGNYYLDEVAPDATVRILVVPNAVPAYGDDNDVVNDAIAVIALTATARTGGGAAALGAALTETAGADTAGVEDTVFADAAGSDDAAGDADHSARDSLVVVAADLTLQKFSAVISDPVNGGTNPKRIPGAVIQYRLTVDNDAGASDDADAVVITDNIPANTSYVDDSLILNDDADCTTTPTALTDGTAADDEGATDDNDPSLVSQVTFGDGTLTLAAGDDITYCYSVTID